VSIDKHSVQGLILAGGQGSRMGGVDKGLQEWQGQPLVSYALSAMACLCDQVIISCNRNVDIYQKLADHTVMDLCPGFEGPLSGLVSVFGKITSDWVLVSPCDTPNVTAMEYQLLIARAEKGVAGISTPAVIYALKGEEKDHPLHCLIHRSAFEDIEKAFQAGQRSVYRVFNRLGVEWLMVTDEARMLNVNSLTARGIHKT
jgi:molybdopterin-guanine dinucleotide biosynthesis protein A